MPPKLNEFLDYKLRSYLHLDLETFINRLTIDLYKLCKEIEQWFITTKQLGKNTESKYPYMIYVGLTNDPPIKQTNLSLLKYKFNYIF